MIFIIFSVFVYEIDLSDYTFEVDLTSLSTVPRETLADFLAVGVRHAVSFVVATRTAQRRLRADSSGIRGVLRQVCPTLFAGALIRTTQVEAGCVRRAIVVRSAFFHLALVEIECLDLGLKIFLSFFVNNSGFF